MTSSKKSRAAEYNLPSPKRGQSIREYARENNVSFYKARYIVSGERYRQNPEQRSYWQRGYFGRIEGMLKRYRNLYGDTDTRFNGNITKEKINEFYHEVIQKNNLTVVDSSRKKKFSEQEEERFRRTAQFFHISEYRQREYYPVR